MKLQATIGRRDNIPIRESADCLGRILSNFGCVPDKGLKVPSIISFLDYLVDYDLRGKAVIRVKNLADPQALYQCLSQEGYALIESKLIQ